MVCVSECGEQAGECGAVCDERHPSVDVLSPAVQTAAGKLPLQLVVLDSCHQAANHSAALLCAGGAGVGARRRRRRPGEAPGAEASGPTAGRTQGRQQVSPETCIHTIKLLLIYSFINTLSNVFTCLSNFQLSCKGLP